MSTAKKGGNMPVFEPVGRSRIFEMYGKTSPELGTAIRQKFSSVCVFFIPFRQIGDKSIITFVQDINEEVCLQQAIQEIDPSNDTIFPVNDYTICGNSWAGIIVQGPQMFSRIMERFAITPEEVVLCDSDAEPYVIVNLKHSAIEKIAPSKKDSAPTIVRRNEGDFKKAQDAWVKFRTSGQESERDKLSKRLTTLRKEKEEIQKKQLVTNQEISEVSKALAYLENNPTQEEQYFIDEFRRFNGDTSDEHHIDGILRAEFDIDKNAFVFYTTTIYGERPDSSKKYFFGTYRISIPLAQVIETTDKEGRPVKEKLEDKHIVIQNLSLLCPQDKPNSSEYLGCHHPHITKMGRACFGSYKEIINAMLKSGKQQDEVAMVIVQSLRSWNSDPKDKWGQSVEFWPEVDPITLEFLDNQFGYLKQKEIELHEKILKEVH